MVLRDVTYRKGIAVIVILLMVLTVIPPFSTPTGASGFRMDSNLKDSHASFWGEDTGDRAGQSVAVAGDVNGDGYDDILIGAWWEDDGGNEAGQTYLILGRASGWAMDTALSNVDASFIGEDAGDRSGVSVAIAGDVNGDKYDDILIGAYLDDDGGGDAGQTYLFFGKASGWAMDTDLSNADASFWGEDTGDYSGFVVAGAGDINSDGYDDILIGAYGDDDGGTDAGQTYLILGKASGWAMDTDLSNADASFWGENGWDNAGRAVAGAGDVNGDGYDDMLIGAYNNDEGVGDAGQSYLILGKASGWSLDTDLSNVDASFWGEHAGDNSGIAVAGAGDVNGDGYDDMLIGAYLDDDPGLDAGQTYIVFGKPSGWAMDISLSNADASYWGENPGDNVGYWSVNAGDVDGDGYDDILIGAYGNDDAGTEAGQTYLILGKASGWTMDTVLSNADASFWGEDGWDYSGQSGAGGGDVNGDGYDDILIGAYGDEDGGGNEAGQTYLIFFESRPLAPSFLEARLSQDGSSISLSWELPGYWKPLSEFIVYRSMDGSHYNELEKKPFFNRTYEDTSVEIGRTYYYSIVTVDGSGALSDMSPPLSLMNDKDSDTDGIGNQFDEDDDGDGIPDDFDVSRLVQDGKRWGKTDVNLSSYGIGFIGEDADDEAGWVAGAGDVNGDGYDDILIGAYKDEDGGFQAGQTYLIFGKASDWTMDTDLSNADASFWGEDANDRSGFSVAGGGDVNGDGYDDILIGAYRDEDGGNEAGQTYLIFGKASGWAMDTDLSNADASFWGEEDTDRSGYSVAGAGDVNRDGYDDILIGAPYNASGGQTYLILGKASGWAMDTDLSNADASFAGENIGDDAGWSVAGAGDVNGDGYDDIIIGAYMNDEGGFSAGQTYLIFGKGSGWAMDIDLSNVDASFWGENPNDFSGQSVAGAGDVNKDGYDDILIGANLNDDGGDGAGQTYLILGKDLGWTMDTDLSVSDASFSGEDASDNSGISVAGAGDVNGDGYDDILIGASYNDEGGFGAGETYLVFGKGSGWIMDNNLTNADASFTGLGGGLSGRRVAGGGDVDGDGYDDILIGAVVDDEGGNNAGQTYLINRSIVSQVKDLSLNLISTQIGINISWDNTYSESYFFGIYRGNSPNSFNRLTSTNALNYTDTNVTPGVTYYYTITGVDPLGGETSFSKVHGMVADIDTDGDGLGNMVDTDDDDDGVPDGEDLFPLNATESLDTDQDGTGNNADTDDDNDGILDTVDPEPFNPLNGLQSDVDYLNTTLHYIHTNVTGLMGKLALMNSNLSALQVSLDDMNASLASLMDGLMTEIQNLSDKIEKLSSDLSDVNDSIQQIIAELRMDVVALEMEFKAMNTSLQLELDFLEAEIQTFRSETASSLQEILDRLDTLELNLINEIDNLGTTINNLNTTTLSEIRQQLTDIENKIVASGGSEVNNTEVLNKIAELKADIEDFKSETNTRLNNITTLMAALDDIASMMEDIETIQQVIEIMKSDLARLNEIESDIKDIEKEQSKTTKKVEEAGGIDMAMVGLLVIILLLVLVILVLGRKEATALEPLKIEKKTVRRPRLTMGRRRIKEVVDEPVKRSRKRRKKQIGEEEPIRKPKKRRKKRIIEEEEE